ncbi:hypothetical protein CSKR_109535 [Clonorchis sinensis]|uniref:Uncharacterized protein n=1 Tax=Clonorchis sinensis TaxID=79923 RepID=A0A3R7C732_CLOSI|nr:hypothetical protein CSKR_109535 [Clonorchis sinensis]
MTARHRKGVTVERFFLCNRLISLRFVPPTQQTLGSMGCGLIFLSLNRLITQGTRWPKWLEREVTDPRVRGSNPTSASRLTLSRLGQPGSIPALVLPSGGMAARHPKGCVTAERLFNRLCTVKKCERPQSRTRWLRWLEREFTDRKVRDSNPTSASRLSLSRLAKPGSIPALVQPSGGTAVRHRKGATPGRFFLDSTIVTNDLRARKLYVTMSSDENVSQFPPRFSCGTLLQENPPFRYSRLDGEAVEKRPLLRKTVFLSSFSDLFVHVTYVQRYEGCDMAQWLEREFSDRKVRGSNPTSASRLPLSRLGQPGSIPALMLPSGGMAVKRRKGATAERLLGYQAIKSQAQAGSRGPHPGRRTTPTTPKLFVISFTPFCQVMRCPTRGLRHSGGGMENNTRLGRRCFSMRSTCSSHRPHTTENFVNNPNPQWSPPIGTSKKGARWRNWLEREFTDRKVRGSNPTSASRPFPCLGLGNLAISQP